LYSAGVVALANRCTALATELGLLGQFGTARSARKPHRCHLSLEPHCRSHQYGVIARQPACVNPGGKQIGVQMDNAEKSHNQPQPHWGTRKAR
jgi:hypothetical protein